MGLLFSERGVTLTLSLINDLHVNMCNRSSSAKRICRQLLALGLFREPNSSLDPKVPWARRCIYDGFNSKFIRCQVCSAGHLISSTKECVHMAPLVKEFLSGPLSLMQLSRIEIRSLIGVRQFERRVNSLKLPPLLLEYVSRANEMLNLSTQRGHYVGNQFKQSYCHINR